MKLSCLVLVLLCCGAASAADLVELTHAAIVVKTPGTVSSKSIEMLVEEIAERTGVTLDTIEAEPLTGPAITLSVDPEGACVPKALKLPDSPESYAIWVDGGARAGRVHLAGRSGRGLLFAVGRLLRVMEMKEGSITLCPEFAISTGPVYPQRGHQIGYRNTANSYDLWDIEEYEQYLRDMIIFGSNSAELTSDFVNGYKNDVEAYKNARDERDGPLMVESHWSMNVKLSALLDAYDLDVWLWEPLSGNVTKPEFAEAEMEWRRQYYAEMPRIDDVIVPGGDPGDTHPDVLMPWMEKQAALLHAHFPEAGVWISNQKFMPEENDSFFGYITNKQPQWLAGVAFGPGTLMSLPDVRKRTPPQYPVSLYPDITHNLRCQYPVPHYDRILAQTLDREGINPRPRQMAQLVRATSPYSAGMVTYSDGIHDDLNKAVTSAMNWDPDAKVEDVVLDYARVFFGPCVAEDVAKGLFALEETMIQPLDENGHTGEILALWEGIGERGGDAVQRNWRYQMYCFRAMFDAYIHARLLVDQQYEASAYDALMHAPELGVDKAISLARAAYAQADMNRVRPELRLKLEDLGLTLLKSCGLQLSMDEPYRARNPERGALLDKLDRPLNDRPWVEAQLAAIETEKDPSTQMAKIMQVVNWENPGPGGFYDDLGNVRKQPHLVRQATWESDPGGEYGPVEAFFRQMDNADKTIAPVRLSWADHEESAFSQPIILRYEGLDPKAQYRVRGNYFGRYGAIMRLMADGNLEVHGELPPTDQEWPIVEFRVPKAATEDGTLELSWYLIKNRGCQVSEVWLIREP